MVDEQLAAEESTLLQTRNWVCVLRHEPMSETGPQGLARSRKVDASRRIAAVEQKAVTVLRDPLQQNVLVKWFPHHGKVDRVLRCISASSIVSHGFSWLLHYNTCLDSIENNMLIQYILQVGISRCPMKIHPSNSCSWDHSAAWSSTGLEPLVTEAKHGSTSLRSSNRILCTHAVDNWSCFFRLRVCPEIGCPQNVMIDHPFPH